MQNSAPMSTTTTDPRDVIAKAISRMTKSGESNIMCARWIMGDLWEAGLSIVPVASGDVGVAVEQLRGLARIHGTQTQSGQIAANGASTLESLAARAEAAEAANAELRAALEKREQWHKCSCPEPCDDYGVFPGGCTGRYRDDYRALLSTAGGKDGD